MKLSKDRKKDEPGSRHYVPIRGKKVTTSVSLEIGQLMAIEFLATEHKKGVNEIIREAVTEYLDVQLPNWRTVG